MVTEAEHLAIWDTAFKAGVADAGALIISALIFDGRTSVRINDLKKYIAEVCKPDLYQSEHILELLESIEAEYSRGVHKA